MHPIYHVWVGNALVLTTYDKLLAKATARDYGTFSKREEIAVIAKGSSLAGDEMRKTVYAFEAGNWIDIPFCCDSHD